MASKRKAQDSATVVDTYKKSRFSEWLSDSDEESESSEAQENVNNDAEEEEGVSEEDSMDEDPKDSSYSFKSERIFTMEQSQKIESAASPSRLQEAPSGTKTTQGTDLSPLNFTDLGVITSLVSSLSAMSIRKPTPVQAACIPPLLQGMSAVYIDSHHS